MMLPTLGNALSVGQLRLLGEILAKAFPREDSASLARFISTCEQGGWITDQQLDWFDLGLPDDALRLVAHETANLLGHQFRFQTAHAFPDHLNKEITAKMDAGLSESDLALLLYAGLEAGLYTDSDLEASLTQHHDERGMLTDWFNSAMESSICTENTNDYVAFSFASLSDNDVPLAEREVALYWGLDETLNVTDLKMPLEDAPADVQLRDLICMICAATQGLVMEFVAPYEFSLDMHCSQYEEDMVVLEHGASQRNLPITAENLLKVAVEILEDAGVGVTDAFSHADIHNPFESFETYCEMKGYATPSMEVLADWTGKLAAYHLGQAKLRNPIQDFSDGNHIDETALLEALNGRFDNELPSVAEHAPKTAAALQAWRNWLNQRVEAGCPPAINEFIGLSDGSLDEITPISHLIHACPGLFFEAEIALAEMEHDSIMCSGGDSAVIRLGRDTSDDLRLSINAMQAANGLCHHLNALGVAREADTEQDCYMG
ncbi:hypothetical protein DU506_01655 [Vreelandella rituensis]|uniref:Uncharacterized protein n=2 Tax=Vreelandella rituensis TaxID=2282306 RepID=A0A368U9U6_9GAMM|nr:hypothetical protein DU506_01655 [Halomonas rituensis]